MKSLRLLLIEDSEDDAMLLELELRMGGFDPDYLRVETPQELESALEETTWDAVISDYSLPSFTGIDALHIIRAKGLDLPFILVSGVIGEEKAVEAMKAGAHDYLMKGSYSRLAPALERELEDTVVRRGRREAEEALRRAHEELEQRVAERTAELARSNEALRTENAGRKQAEEKIRKLNEELEERVRERTSQLEAVNKELEAFSYSVSHDLKAPLRGIDGYCRLLEKGYHDSLDDEGRLFIRNVCDGTARMHELIEDLLTYSRVERRVLQSTSLDLPALVQAVVAERTAEVEHAGAQLRLEVPHLIVSADRDGLAIVLRNLLENALKFSRNARPPTVEIGARAEGDRVILWVRDNGIGFDMKFHDRIFEIFQRLQRAEEYPGTGIGLALVRKAMMRMGGRAWAESVPGEGATFFLEIPQ